LGATMLFGFFQALALRPDVVERLLTVKVPIPALDALPYVLTVIVLAGFIGKAIPPRAGDFVCATKQSLKSRNHQ
ncbi:MAG: hypothetical protein HC767_15790, partial [Akkermansiaceae bacterium]|nr:hypothetical protein [Akkermansiaceae bacterium]